MSAKSKNAVIRRSRLILVAVWSLLLSVQTHTVQAAIDGCSAPISSSDYGGWSEGDFTLSNLVKNESGHLVLDPAGISWDQEGIALDAVKDISVTYVYQDGGLENARLGWLYDASSDMPEGEPRWIFDPLGSSPGSETQTFLTDPEGAALPYGSNARIVFVLELADGTRFYTKKAWNPVFESDCGSSNYGYAKKIKFYEEFAGVDSVCRKTNKMQFDTVSGYDAQGWLNAAPRSWLQEKGYGIPQGDINLKLIDGEKTPKAVMAAPDNVENAVILGFDAVNTNNAFDFNDLVFLVTFKTVGVIRLNNGAAMVPGGYHGFYTQLQFEAWDGMPAGSEVAYYYSVHYLTDSYANFIPDAAGQQIPVWHEIEASDWGEVHSFTAQDGTALFTEDQKPDIDETNILENWKNTKSPTYTHRKAVIDLVGKAVIGRDLLWKAELRGGRGTSPMVVDVKLSALVSRETVSRSVPVVQTNVVYSGSFDLPDPLDPEWFADPEARGHLKAVMIYDPETARASEAARSVIWDAGEKLSQRDIGTSPRTIYFPSMTENSYAGEALVTIQSGVTAYSGTLTHVPVLDGTFVVKTSEGTVVLSDGHDKKNELSGISGMSGTIDLDSGEYTIQLGNDPVLDGGTQLAADYKSYSVISSSGLSVLGTDTVSDALLNLAPSGGDDTSLPTNSELVNWILGYQKNGSTEQRLWLLGAVDHSAPAVMTPPGFPEWVFGSKVDNTMKASFHDPAGEDTTTFRAAHENRDVVVFVGARDGMLHAFDGGRFNWGDNPKTIPIEHRGHFVWSGETKETAQYGTGSELWAYIPGNLLGKMKNLYGKTGDSEAWLDASPALGDVYTNGAWRTVLIVCQGNGGHMVTCLDVTDPADPALLWEKGDPDLFNSRSSPVIGMIENDQWVAFLLSGVTDPADHPVIYMIDIASGAITRIPLDAAGESGKGGVGSGQPAAVDSDGDGYVDRLYVGTDKGFMYRVAIDGGVFSDLIVNSSERNAGEGIYGAPAVVTDDEGVRVFFGTGGDASATYHFYAYLDSKRGGTDSTTLEWSYALPAGHGVYASVFAAAGQVYFSTTTAVTEDPCEAGGASEGNLYAFKQVLDGANETIAPLSEIPLPKGSGRVAPIVDDQHLYIKTAFGTLQSFGGTTYNNEAAGVADGEIAVPVPEATIRSWREVR